MTATTTIDLEQLRSIARLSNRMTVLVGLRWSVEVSVEVDVPLDASDDEIRDAAVEGAQATDPKEYNIYDSDLVHVVVKNDRYIY